jgi:hypothetical protein
MASILPCASKTVHGSLNPRASDSGKINASADESTSSVPHNAALEILGRPAAIKEVTTRVCERWKYRSPIRFLQ